MKVQYNFLILLRVIQEEYNGKQCCECLGRMSQGSRIKDKSHMRQISSAKSQLWTHKNRWRGVLWDVILLQIKLAHLERQISSDYITQSSVQGRQNALLLSKLRILTLIPTIITPWVLHSPLLVASLLPFLKRENKPTMINQVHVCDCVNITSKTTSTHTN